MTVNLGFFRLFFYSPLHLIIANISPNTTWYFTKFESNDTEALRIKKIKLRRYGFKGSFGVYDG